MTDRIARCHGGLFDEITGGCPIHIFETRTIVPAPLAEVFPFFSDAWNLERITPPWLHFQVLTPPPIVMREGLRIDYRLRLHGIPLRWQSEITAWEPPVRFVDEQRVGPYRRWVHEHTFREQEGGTWMQDRVEYAVPGGALVNRIFVARDLQRIFAGRATRVREWFKEPRIRA